MMLSIGTEQYGHNYISQYMAIYNNYNVGMTMAVFIMFLHNYIFNIIFINKVDKVDQAGKHPTCHLQYFFHQLHCCCTNRQLANKLADKYQYFPRFYQTTYVFIPSEFRSPWNSSNTFCH